MIGNRLDGRPARASLAPTLAPTLLLLAITQTAAASTATTVYRAKQKDTLDLIAAEYYGDRAYGVFIVVENKLKKPTITPFMRLRVPITREITTAKGDTFASLAQTHLGDEKRAQFLADYNNLPVDESLATGTAVTIPFQITYVSDNGESLGALAARFYGDSKQADLLKRYNFLDKPTLEKSEAIEVPALNVRVRPARLPALDNEAKDRRRQLAKISEMAATALPAARAAYAQGDFAHVRDVLAPFADQLEYLDSTSAVAIGMLLGKAHVAFGNTDAAVKAFAQIHERKSTFKVRAYDESPKVLDAWKQAGGEAQ
jgi:LysM repeat protein